MPVNDYYSTIGTKDLIVPRAKNEKMSPAKRRDSPHLSYLRPRLRNLNHTNSKQIQDKKHLGRASLFHPREVLEQVSKENKQLAEKWKRKKLSMLVAQVEASERKKEALEKLVAARGEEETEIKPPKERAGKQTIGKEVRALVGAKVLKGETTQQIRFAEAEHGCRRTPVIGLTASGGSQQGRAGGRHGRLAAETLQPRRARLQAQLVGRCRRRREQHLNP